MPFLRVCEWLFSSTPTSKDCSLGTPERKKSLEVIPSRYSNSGFAIPSARPAGDYCQRRQGNFNANKPRSKPAKSTFRGELKEGGIADLTP
jgi:hypothetical protein